MVVINFLDGTHLVIEKGTVLNGYKNNKSDEEFYLSNVFSDSIDGRLSKEASKLSTVNPQIGILGFILSVDCFSAGLDTENNVVYLSSAVKSVENHYDRVSMMPSLESVNIKK